MRRFIPLLLCASSLLAADARSLRREASAWQRRLNFDGWKVHLVVADADQLPAGLAGSSTSFPANRVVLVTVMSDAGYAANGWTAGNAARDADQRNTVVHELAHVLLHQSGLDAGMDHATKEATVDAIVDHLLRSRR